eukprot:9499394-Pyramimonas_sp.AAC.1
MGHMRTLTENKRAYALCYEDITRAIPRAFNEEDIRRCEENIGKGAACGGGGGGGVADRRGRAGQFSEHLHVPQNPQSRHQRHLRDVIQPSAPPKAAIGD